MSHTSSTPMTRTYGPPAYQAIVQPGERWPYTTADTYDAAEQALAILRQSDPEGFAGARIVLLDRLWTDIEAGYLAEPIRETTRKEFHDMLDVLPPLAWKTSDGFERFNISEMTCGRITRQWARFGNRYFSRLVRHGDTSTYMTPESLAATFPSLHS
jgi:hypothetical protein